MKKIVVISALAAVALSAIGTVAFVSQPERPTVGWTTANIESTVKIEAVNVGSLRRANRFPLTAYVNNQSKQTVAAVKVRMKAYSCGGQTGRGDCELWGEITKTLEVVVPAYQSRPVEVDFVLDETPPNFVLNRLDVDLTEFKLKDPNV